jgi:hypothetical protein
LPELGAWVVAAAVSELLVRELVREAVELVEPPEVVAVESVVVEVLSVAEEPVAVVRALPELVPDAVPEVAAAVGREEVPSAPATVNAGA